jgi:hypothetical protein
MVSGIDVYPVKSLVDVIHFVSTGNGIAPLKVDGDTMLSESQHYAVDFKDIAASKPRSGLLKSPAPEATTS